MAKKAEQKSKAVTVRRVEPAPIRHVADEFDRMFDRMTKGFWEPWSRLEWPSFRIRPRLISEFEWAPSVDVLQKDGKTVVRADLPGVKREDIDISVEGDMLTIKGCREEEKEKKGKDYFVSERASGEFCRTLRLPEGITAEQVEASYKDGVLEVSFPSPKPVKSEAVKLKVS
jgi:HSP20 family protein